VNGAPSESDQRGAAERGHRALDRLGDPLERRRAEVAEPGDVVGGAHRRRQDRADTGRDVHVHPGQAERDDDVAEEDPGVDVVPADRLQGDLARERRVQARVEHGDARARRAVLRERAPRLPHEPHRAAARGAAPERGDQRGVRRPPVDKRVRLCKGHPTIVPNIPTDG